MSSKSWFLVLVPALLASCAAPRATPLPDLSTGLSAGFGLSRQHGDSSGHGNGHAHANHIAVFAGAVNKEDHHHEKKTAGAVGIDFEHRINDSFGAGLVMDFGSHPFRSSLTAIGLFYHPMDHLTFIVAPGVENEHGHVKAMTRVGVAYGFDIGSGVTLSPSLFYDIVEDAENGLVFGFSFGTGF